MPSSFFDRIFAFSTLANYPLDSKLQLVASVGVSAVREAQLGPAIFALASEIHGTTAAAAQFHERGRSRAIQPAIHQAATAGAQATGLIALSLLSPALANVVSLLMMHRRGRMNLENNWLIFVTHPCARRIVFKKGVHNGD
jgi:hypothetical protein